MTPWDEMVKTATYDEAEYWFRDGRISYEVWQRYRCLWRNGAARFSELAGEHDGHDPANCPIAATLETRP